MLSPKFGLGDKVFVKMRGYTPWPAKVEGIVDNNQRKIRYKVYFYGTRQIGMCNEADIFSYAENVGKYGKPKNMKGFKEGLKELESELAISGSEQTNGEIAYNCKPNLSLTTTSMQKVSRKSCVNKKSIPAKISQPVLTPHKSWPIFKGSRKTDAISIQVSEQISGVLKVEAKMNDIIFDIQCYLGLKVANVDACLECLDALQALEIKPLMVKKHPEVVVVMNKLQHYVGNLKNWDMSEEESKSFNSKAALVRKKAKEIINYKIQPMFLVQPGTPFFDFFKDELVKFNTCTKGMAIDDLIRLTKDPTHN